MGLQRIIQFGLLTAVLFGISACTTVPDPPSGTVFEDYDECPEMVVIPAGDLTLRSLRATITSYRSRAITFDYSFAIGRYEVTFEEWDACVEGGGCNGYLPNDEGWGRENRPVMNVSHDDAIAYTEWLSARTGYKYRLPSEMEWEYAAQDSSGPRAAGARISRANLPTDQAMGSIASELEPSMCDYANHYSHYVETRPTNRRDRIVPRPAPYECDDGYEFTAPVGSYTANGSGLFDTLGNVAEHVQDCVEASDIDPAHGFQGAPVNGAARLSLSCQLYGSRGGSWLGLRRHVDVEERLHTARHYGDRILEHGPRQNRIGFRVVRELGTPAPEPVIGHITVIKNHQMADPLIEACDDGDGASCAELAAHFGDRRSTAVEQNVREEVRLLIRGCRLGQVSICEEAAYSYRSLNDAWPPSDDTSWELQSIACDAGLHDVCDNIAYSMFRISTNSRHMEPYSPEAMELRSRAINIWAGSCLLEDIHFCLSLLRLILFPWTDSDGEPHTLGLLEDGCAVGVGRSCGYLGLLVNEGAGFPQDEVRATYLFDRGCRLGHRVSCCPSQSRRWNRAAWSNDNCDRRCPQGYEDGRLGTLRHEGADS